MDSSADMSIVAGKNHNHPTIRDNYLSMGIYFCVEDRIGYNMI